MDSVNKFKEMFENSPIGIIFYDKEGNLTEINQSALNIMGITLNQSKKFNLFENPDIQLRRIELLDNKLIKFQAPLNFDYNKESSSYDLTKTSQAFIDYLVSVIDSGFIMQIQDITEKTEAEKNLRESEARFSSVLNNSPDVIYRFNLKTGYYEYMSPAIRKLNFEPEELMSMSNEEVISRVHPEDQPKLISVLSQLNEIGEGSCEYRFKGNDDKYRWWSNHMVIVKNSQGQPLYRDGFVRDITELKKAEKTLHEERDLLQNVMNGAKNSDLVYLDCDFNFMLVNEAYAQTCGYKPEEMIGKNHFDLYPDEENEAIFAYVRETGKSVEYHDKPFKFPDQPDRGITYWDWTLIPIKSKEEVVGLIFSLYETTKRKQAELRIQEMLENEQQLTEELKTANEELQSITEELQTANEELRSTTEELQTANEELRSTTEELQTANNELKTKEIELLKLNNKQQQLIMQRQLALDAAKMGWWHYDPVTDVSRYDEQYKRIFGVYGSQSPNKELLKRLHPDDLSNVWKKVEKALDPADPKPYSSEYRIFLDDGSLRWIEAHGIATFKGEGVNRYANSLVGTVADITERKKAENNLQKNEAQFQALIHNLHSAIALIDETGKFVVVNPAFMQMFGLNHEMDILNVNSQDWSRWKVYDENGNLLHVDKHPVRKVALTSKSVKNQLVSVKNPGDDRLTYMLISAEPVLNHDGSVNMIICTYFDITEHERAEEKLKITNKELIQTQNKLEKTINKLKTSNAELEQFAYVASHDLQEPLRMVSSFTQLLEMRYKDKLDDEALEYIKFAVDGAKRMRSLINDLLAYSRVTNREYNYEKLNMEKALDEALFNLEIIIKETHAIITRDPLPNVYGDFNQMVQIFQNLIGNAIKYRGEKTPQIQVTVKSELDNWIFKVKDNGIGINTEYYNQIFQIFRRLHTQDEYQGTGIGLAITKRIIENHGGKIWVNSEPGKWSEFYFTIPKTC